MTSRALLIAVDTYNDDRIRNLRAPRGDIAALAEVLADPALGGFEVQKLINPTSTALHRTVEVFFRSARKDDLLLLHFAGHGFLDDRNRLRLAARDTEEEFLSSTALLTTNIVEIAEQSHSRRTVFIIDCCYSARFFDALSARGDRSVHLPAQFPIQGKGTVVLAASGDLEYAFEDRGSSLFTRALVDGLRSGAADTDGDGWISVTDLYAYVLERLRDLGAAQTPRLLGDREGDLFIARARRAQPAARPAPPPPEREVPPPRVAAPPPRDVRTHPRRDSDPGSAGATPMTSSSKPEPAVQRPARQRSTDVAGADSTSAVPAWVEFTVGLVVIAAVPGGLVWLILWLTSKAHVGWLDIVLWTLAVILAVAGILALFRRQILWGLTLVMVAVLVGPAGISIFS